MTLDVKFLDELAAEARQADETPSWPEPSWNALKRTCILRANVPAEYGGEPRSGIELLEAYESLAGACLTSCFILSQRDAAIRRLLDHGQPAMLDELLPPLASGETFTTVGLSQLTTSRQHGKPSITVRADGGDFIFDGAIPWVTGAVRAEHVVIGAVLDDGGQVLAVLPMASPGVSVGPPLELMALQGSMTAEVRCREVRVGRRWLLAAPRQAALQAPRGGTGGLETSCLGLGLTAAAVGFLRTEAGRRPDLADDVERLDQQRRELRGELFQMAVGETNPRVAQSLRMRVNTFVLHATQAALTASKGTGFLRNHPAQRWARQALFFLVWSCPAPVASATMAYFSSPAACGLA